MGSVAAAKPGSARERHLAEPELPGLLGDWGLPSAGDWTRLIPGAWALRDKDCAIWGVSVLTGSAQSCWSCSYLQKGCGNRDAGAGASPLHDPSLAL